MFTADQIVAHLVGDYLLQSDWMAQEKTKSLLAAGVHAAFYTVPFVLLTGELWALVFIAGSHFIIDHWRLARYVCWAKNWISPRPEDPKPWKDCSDTGYDPSRPLWLSVWLLIIADNTLHIMCNGLALFYLG